VVTSHSYWAHRGMSTIILVRCVSQASNPKERKFVWGTTTVFTHSVFVHEQQVESNKESLEMEQPWRENSRACWRIFGAFWS
jgi:hypothetical protein